MTERAPDLTARVGPLTLKNPVMPASGTFGWVREYEKFYDPALLGAVIPKTVTLDARSGNRPQRVVETASGLLNSIGLQNPGFNAFRNEYWPYIEKLDTVKIVNISAETIDEFGKLAEYTADLSGLHAMELNISCPNVNRNGRIFGTDPERIRMLLEHVKKRISIPVITKLTPNVTDITETARAAADGGSDILSLTNTFLGMAIDTSAGKPVISNIRAGLSGPAVKPLSLRMVYDTAQTVDLPIIGIGGITSGQDALEFIMAGASAVQVGTANLADPFACPNILSELGKALAENGCKCMDEAIGVSL